MTIILNRPTQARLFSENQPPMKSRIYLAQATELQNDPQRTSGTGEGFDPNNRTFLFYHDLSELMTAQRSNSETAVSFDYVAGYLNCAFQLANEDPTKLEIYNGIPKSVYHRFARLRPRPLLPTQLERLLDCSRLSPVFESATVQEAD